MIEKMTTLLRSGIRESVDHITDANAIRIFEQEIHDCETSLSKSKVALAQVIAEKIRLQRQVTALQKAIEKREKQAVFAMSQQDEALVEEIALGIVADEANHDSLAKNLSLIESQEITLTENIRASAHKVKSYRTELSVAKAVELRQCADRKLAGVSQKNINVNQSLESSLARIKDKQQWLDDQCEAFNQVESQFDENKLNRTIQIDEKSQSDNIQSEKIQAVLVRIKRGLDKA